MFLCEKKEFLITDRGTPMQGLEYFHFTFRKGGKRTVHVGDPHKI